jgi:hypothetical protein
MYDRFTHFLRLMRPLLHTLLIGVVFVGVYFLRLRTDLIPGVQLDIPPIVIYEFVWFTVIAIVLFLIL